MIFYQLSLGLILTLPWIYFRASIEMGMVIVIQLFLINIAVRHFNHHHLYIVDIKKMLNKVNNLEKLINNIKGTNEAD